MEIAKRHFFRAFLDAINPYAWAMICRNRAFETGVLKSYRFGTPTICIGNISVGGTGKTPHTEYIIELLREHYRTAVLSRGYGRKSKGYIKADTGVTMQLIGDEPFQIKNKFKDLTVAVSEKRVEGIERLMAEEPELQVILLDDAYQHRYVDAGLKILLIDSNRPVWNDNVMPFGRLRESTGGIKRADIVIITKCPGDINAWEKSQWAEALGIRMYEASTCSGKRSDGRKQYLFFTKIQYDTPLAVFDGGDPRYVYSKRLVLFSGIANDAPMKAFLSSDYKIVRHLKFADHHKFSWADIRSIEDAVKDYPTAVAMTTEKDCQRLRDCKNISDNLKMRLFYTPIKSEFLCWEDKEQFTAVLTSFLK